MMRGMLALFVAAIASATSLADIYGPGPGGDVPDAIGITPGVLVSPIVIANTAQPTITSVNGVTLTFSTPHTYVGDLVLVLTAPNGDDVQLIRRIGVNHSSYYGDGSDFGGPYTFVNSGGADIIAAALASDDPVPPGTYNRTSESEPDIPDEDPDDFAVFDLDDINGTWTLTVFDYAGGDVGTFGSWYLDITSVPEPSSMALAGLASLVGLALVRLRKK